VVVVDASCVHYVLVGAPVVETDRLWDGGEAEQILFSEVVHTLLMARRRVRFLLLGPVELKGLPAAVTAYEVEWDPPQAPPAPAAAAAPASATGADAHSEAALPNRLRRYPPFGFFGRDAEQTALADAWKAARSGRGQVVLLSGEPGIGKTALTAELARRVHAHGAGGLYG